MVDRKYTETLPGPFPDCLGGAWERGYRTIMFVIITFIATLIRFVTMSLVYEIKNNGDKFYRRKFMRAAD